jgi:hypothetical protein
MGGVLGFILGIILMALYSWWVAIPILVVLGLLFDYKYGRKIKHIDIEPQKSGVYLVGDRVYLFSYEDEVGVMVENKNIANFLKEIFEVEWRQSK